MDASMIDAAARALVLILEPTRIMYLMGGVVLGLVMGIIPGIGGLAGLALLMPFTFSMDPYTAFAFLLGLASVTATGDPIPAIMFGVPGGAGSAATVLDGLPMAKRGEAGRALSAAYMSSLIGGLFGAALLGLTIPLLRPAMLYIGSPELLAMAIFGISMVAVLSGSAPLRGLTAGGLGIMFAMIGSDPQSGTLRWTMGELYLFDGLQLLPVTLGLFALPELCDLAISRAAISSKAQASVATGMWQGAKDVFRHWWLVLRCSWLGAGLGAVPGIGAAIIDWMAYGHALKTEKGAQQSFGTGDVRGVIASESANNAREGGALVPTVAFGVPASAGMAVLLGAFMVHGLVPGPDMLNKNLDVTYSMVWSIAIANLLGAGLCYLFSGHFAKLATLRYTLIMPSVLAIIYIGAFEGSRNWGDIHTLLFFGVLGWLMKQLKWPRPPLILGFVLGEIIERYTFISVSRYGLDWLIRPVVVLFLGLALLGLLRPLVQDLRRKGALAGFAKPSFRPGDLFYVFVVGLLGVMLYAASTWRHSAAQTVPIIVGTMATVFAVLSAFNLIFRRSEERQRVGLAEEAKSDVAQRLHMDIVADTAHLDRGTIYLRATAFLAWFVGFMVSMAAIGLIPTLPIFVIAYMRIEGREPWTLVLPQAAVLTAFIYIVFDQGMAIPWPPTLLGQMWPALKFIPSV
jgi:TctA family transporter